MQLLQRLNAGKLRVARLVFIVMVKGVSRPTYDYSVRIFFFSPSRTLTVLITGSTTSLSWMTKDGLVVTIHSTMIRYPTHWTCTSSTGAKARTCSNRPSKLRTPICLLRRHRNVLGRVMTMVSCDLGHCFVVQGFRALPLTPF